jgi:hypothetical protein
MVSGLLLHGAAFGRRRNIVSGKDFIADEDEHVGNTSLEITHGSVGIHESGLDIFVLVTGAIVTIGRGSINGFEGLNGILVGELGIFVGIVNSRSRKPGLRDGESDSEVVGSNDSKGHSSGIRRIINIVHIDETLIVPNDRTVVVEPFGVGSRKVVETGFTRGQIFFGLGNERRFIGYGGHF